MIYLIVGIALVVYALMALVLAGVAGMGDDGDEDGLPLVVLEPLQKGGEILRRPPSLPSLQTGAN